MMTIRMVAALVLALATVANAADLLVFGDSWGTGAKKIMYDAACRERCFTFAGGADIRKTMSFRNISWEIVILTTKCCRAFENFYLQRAKNEVRLSV